MDPLAFVSFAATTLGCRLGGAALFIGLGCVALFSRQIADALFQRPDLITDRRPPSAERGESRRLYAKVARWTARVGRLRSARRAARAHRGGPLCLGV